MTVKLTWVPRVTGIEQRLYRSTSGLDPAAMPPPFDVLAADAHRHDDVSAAADTRYFYVIGTVSGSPEQEVYSHFVEVFTGDIAPVGPAPVHPVVGYELAGGRADLDGFVFDAKAGIYKTAGAVQTLNSFFTTIVKPQKRARMSIPAAR